MPPDGGFDTRSRSRKTRLSRVPSFSAEPYPNFCDNINNFANMDFGSLIQADPALTHGLDTLGNCNNDDSCGDQRCISHFNNAMGTSLSTTLSPDFEGCFFGIHSSNPASALQSPGLHGHSLEASPSLHGLGSDVLSNFNGSDSRNTARAQSLHWATGQFNHHHNQAQFHASPSPFSNHGQLPNGAPLHGWEPLFHNSNAITDTTFSATPFGTHHNTAHYGSSLTGFDDCGSMDCNSKCDINCWGPCESGPGVCCFDESCTQASSQTICCFDDDCGGNPPCIGETCVDDLCHGASHPCTDANCLVPGTTVSSTPVSATVRTPPSFSPNTLMQSFSPTFPGTNFGIPPPTKRRKSDMTAPESFNKLMDKLGEKDVRPGPFSTHSIAGDSSINGDSRSMNLENQYMCHWQGSKGICGEVLQNDEELQNHCKTKHLTCLQKEAEGFRCFWDGCTRNAPFTQKSKLERHLQTHTGFKPVKCNICGLQLSAKQSLDQHLRIHSGEKPWKCKFPGCSQAFKQQSALTMHERTHTGEKPLKCEICGKTFGESSNLSKHRRIHNKRGGFFCQLCGKDFHRQDQLRRHMFTNHKVDLKVQTPKPEPGMKPAPKTTLLQIP